MLNSIFAESNIKCHKINNSLSATEASELFDAGVTEEKFCHRSLEALKCYEKASYMQHKAIINILCLKRENYIHSNYKSYFTTDVEAKISACPAYVQLLYF